MARGGERWLATAEVALLFALVVALAWLMRRWEGINLWQARTLGYPVLPQLLLLVLLPGLAGALMGRGFRVPGVSLSRPMPQLDLGLTSLLIFGPAYGVAFPIIILLGSSPQALLGSLILCVTYAISAPLLWLLLRGYSPQPPLAGSARALLLVVGVMLASAGVMALAWRFTPLAGAVLYPLAFVGIGEEVFFRGYVQGRLNEIWGRPWCLGKVNFGPGLLAAALLFGLAHPLVAADPSRWAWALWTFAAGLLLGYLRELSGGVLAPIIAHGVPEVVPYVIGAIYS